MSDVPRGSQLPEITELLKRWGGGDDEAFHDVLDAVYTELHKVARGYFSREKTGHTLQPTALVHEACLRLMKGARPELRNRKHFFALAALQMRHVLVEHARGRDTDKRGGGSVHVSLDGADAATDPLDPAILDLDAALARLEASHPRKARVAVLRYFGGLEVGEIAEALGTSTSTVEKDWAFARAWLRRALTASR